MTNRHSLAALAAASILVMGGAPAALAQTTPPASDAPPAGEAATPTPGIAPEQMPPVPAPPHFYSARELPSVYAPGPGYGRFTRAPKQRICYTIGPASCGTGGPIGYLSGPASYATVGLATFAVAAALF